MNDLVDLSACVQLPNRMLRIRLPFPKPATGRCWDHHAKRTDVFSIELKLLAIVML